MNELNKQLNELLGIKPKYGYVNRTELVDSKIDEYMKEVYPNLFLPENFVKLLELIIQNGDIEIYQSGQGSKCGIYNSFETYWASKSEDMKLTNIVIKALINLLEVKPCKEFIHQAQQVEWKR